MNRTLVIGVVSVALLVTGLWLAFAPMAPKPPLPPPGAGELGDPGEDVVARAMRDAPVPPAPVDSTEIKQRWQDDVPELELAALTAEQREVFLRHANTRRCSCGCGFTLAACRAYDSQCDVSGPRIAALFDSVRAGRITRVAGMRQRRRAEGS